LSYAAKFYGVLHFFMPKEKVEEIGKRRKLRETNRTFAQWPLFLWRLPRGGLLRRTQP
jgi:hypothetical protein